MRGKLGLWLALAVAACASGDLKDDKPQPTTSAGRQGTAIVPAAVQARSTNYKLIGTVTVGNGWASSSRFTKHGGIVGATQP